MKKTLFGFALIMVATFFLSFFISSQPTNRGIVVAVNDKYANLYFHSSLAHLRNNLNCQLPIQVWHSGDELSKENIEKLGKYPLVTFHDISQVLQVAPEKYRGWQIKPKIIALANFDEVLLIDADVFFFENPEIIFDHADYKKTGAFFFSDHVQYFPKYGNGSMNEIAYLNRRNFIKSLIPQPSDCVLKDVLKFWSDDIPTWEKPLIGDVQESGCVAYNKSKHEKSLENTVKLNDDHQNTYRYIYGDKETYWIGCEMAKISYKMNEQRPYCLKSRNEKVDIVQFLDKKMFYQQKNPIAVDPEMQFLKSSLKFVAYPNAEEIAKIKLAYSSLSNK